MNDIKIYLFTAFVILFNLGVNAQKTGFYWNDLNAGSNRLQGKLRGEIYRISAVSNDLFFLQKEWKDASITLMDGDVFENVRLRYLAYGDEIIAYNDNVRTLFKIDKETVKEFSYKNEGTNEEIKFIKFCSPGVAKGCKYYQELYSGNSKLLAFHYVEEIKVNPYTDKSGILRDSEFKLNTSYFLSNDTHNLLKIQRKRRSFVKNFPEHKKEIKRILRKNKVYITNHNSLIQAFTLFDDVGIFN